MRTTRANHLAVLIVLAALALLLVTIWAAARPGRADAANLAKLPLPAMYGYNGVGLFAEFACEQKVIEAAGVYDIGEVMVYTAAQRLPTKDDVLHLAGHLGLPVSAERSAELPHTQERFWYGATLSPWDIDVHDNGTYTLRNREVQEAMQERPPGTRPLQVKKLRAAADAFLKRTGLLPRDCRFTAIRERGSMYSTTRAGKNVHTVLLYGVTYTRYLQGIPAGGVTVDVTPEGVIAGVTSRYRPVTPLARYPILSSVEALETLRSGGAVIMGPGGANTGGRGGPLRAVIDTITLTYPDTFAPLGEYVDYLAPLWLLEGRTFTQGGRLLLWDPIKAQVPALRAEYLDPSLPAVRGYPGGG